MHLQFLFIGTTELLLIGSIAFLLFGGKKLPEMMRGLGQGVREFKKGVKEVKSEIDSDGQTDKEFKQDTEKSKVTDGQIE
ncbi:MAG: twin-arginine translocase TatA/TatE family subunit [Bacteroidaceae bacterium]|nr:twin-arginine translocase TatA/TatE family subunit [Bacteroidaceae bacterium]